MFSCDTERRLIASYYTIYKYRSLYLATLLFTMATKSIKVCDYLLNARKSIYLFLLIQFLMFSKEDYLYQVNIIKSVIFNC